MWVTQINLIKKNRNSAYTLRSKSYGMPSHNNKVWYNDQMKRFYWLTHYWSSKQNQKHMPIQNVYLTMFKNRWNMLTLLVEQWHKKTLLGWDPLIFFVNRIFLNLFLNSQISLSLNSKCKVSPFQGHFFLFNRLLLHVWLNNVCFIYMGLYRKMVVLHN